MLPFFFSIMTTFLCIRQGVIISYKKWSFYSSLLFIFFLILSLLFLKKGLMAFEVVPFLILSAILTPWLIYDVHCLKNSTFQFSATRLILGSIFTLFALLFLSSVVLPHLHDHEAVLKIEMTAEEKKEVITWKHPDGPLCRDAVLRRRFIVSTLDGKVLFDDYLSGDMACIRIKQLLAPTWLQAIGVPSLWDADAISSDYISIDEKKAGPIEVRSLAMIRRNVFSGFLWSFWEKGFFSGEPPFPLGTSIMNSAHIPLVDTEGKSKKGVFMLHLSQKNPSAFTTSADDVAIVN